MDEIPLGVYGLRMTGLPAAADESFVPVDPDAPEVAVEVRLASSLAAAEHCDDSSLVLAVARGQRCEIRRDPAEAILSFLVRPTVEALVHPLLSIVGSAHSRWRGALTLHGGAVVADGLAWAILAHKEGGKSTTLAGLEARGYAVLTDDLVVVHGADVLAGPRSIDLRPDAAAHLGQGASIGIAGGRERHRIVLGRPPARAPLAGVVLLSWSEGGVTGLRQLGVDERLRQLFRHEALPIMGSQPPGLLFQALPLPMYELSRPRLWEAHEPAIDVLAGLMGSASTSTRRARPVAGGSSTATEAWAPARSP